MLGTRHAEGERYISEFVTPRLVANGKLLRELRLDRRPTWAMINGVYQSGLPVKIDAHKITALIQMIVKGLYAFHVGTPLSEEFWPDVTMLAESEEAALWAAASSYFPEGSRCFEQRLGRGSFIYQGITSSLVPGLSAWQITWHEGIRLHGSDGTGGADHWWAFTRPTKEAVVRAAVRVEAHEAPPAQAGGASWDSGGSDPPGRSDVLMSPSSHDTPTTETL
jgi:hypothetical protein